MWAADQAFYSKKLSYHLLSRARNVLFFIQIGERIVFNEIRLCLFIWRRSQKTKNHHDDNCVVPVITTTSIGTSEDIMQTLGFKHHNDVIMSVMTSQITSLTIIYSTVYSYADQRKHQSSASLAFVRGVHRLPVNSPHKGPVTRKVLPFNDVIINSRYLTYHCFYNPVDRRSVCSALLSPSDATNRM